jgi:type II secretory pathway predicted ATPase ExeA
LDPFASTADAASYLPREATESALARLEEGFRRGRRVQVLSGPPGLGKTLLLHVLAARLEGELRSVYLPYASLSWLDLCAWILGLLGEPAGSYPDRELLASARRSGQRGRPLLLLVDEASGIPKDSAEQLGQLVVEAEGALRLLLVPVDDPRAGRVLAVLARDVEELRLSAPLSLEETERYVRTRLVRSGAPEAVLLRFDADTVAQLHRASGGNVRRLHHLAGEVLRGNAAALPGSEARAALGAVPREGDTLEVDGAAAGEGDSAAFGEAELPAPRAARPAAWPAASLAPAPTSAVRPAPSAAAPGAPSDAHPPAAAHAGGEPAASEVDAYEPPLGPREPERTNWWFVVAVNLVIFAGMLAGLWFSGFFPPP